MKAIKNKERLEHCHRLEETEDMKSKYNNIFWIKSWNRKRTLMGQTNEIRIKSDI